MTQRAAAATAAVWTLGLSLGVGPAAGAGRDLVTMDFTQSQILLLPPNSDHVQGNVAPDQTLTVNIAVTDIDDPTAQAGQVDITIDLSEVAGRVDVVGLSADCTRSAPDTVTCAVRLGDVPSPVPVPQQSIGLRAVAGAPVGPAGTIHLAWGLNGIPAPTTAEIDVVVLAATTPSSTAPPPTTATTTTHPPTTRSVIRPTTLKPTMSPSPSPSSTPELTMSPDPTPEPNPGGGDPLAGGPPAPIPFATPPGDGPAWRSPALLLSLGTAAVGLLIAMVYAAISLRRAGRD